MHEWPPWNGCRSEIYTRCHSLGHGRPRRASSKARRHSGPLACSPATRCGILSMGQSLFRSSSVLGHGDTALDRLGSSPGMPSKAPPPFSSAGTRHGPTSSDRNRRPEVPETDARLDLPVMQARLRATVTGDATRHSVP